MTYTVEGYKEFGGFEIDETTLLRLLKRAERDIDLLLGGNINLSLLSDVQKKLLSYAVYSQVEFLAVNGETTSLSGSESGSFSIGAYSESTSKSQSTKSAGRYAPSVLDYLYRAGVIYRAVPLI